MVRVIVPCLVVALLACGGVASPAPTGEAAIAGPSTAPGCGSRPDCHIADMHSLAGGAGVFVVDATEPDCTSREVWLIRSDGTGQLVAKACAQEWQEDPPDPAVWSWSDESGALRVDARRGDATVDSVSVLLDPAALDVLTGEILHRAMSGQTAIVRWGTVGSPVVVWSNPDLSDTETTAVAIPRTTSASSGCGVLVDGSPDHGWTDGSPSGGDASFVAEVAQGRLVVDVTDDHVVDQGAVVDTLTVTSASAAPWWDAAASLRQWQIAASGVVSGDGGAPDVRVERTPTGLRVTMPEPTCKDCAWTPLSISWADTDDGTTVERTIATSSAKGLAGLGAALDDIAPSACRGSPDPSRALVHL